MLVVNLQRLNALKDLSAGWMRTSVVLSCSQQCLVYMGPCTYIGRRSPFSLLFYVILELRVISMAVYRVRQYLRIRCRLYVGTMED